MKVFAKTKLALCLVFLAFLACQNKPSYLATWSQEGHLSVEDFEGILKKEKALWDSLKGKSPELKEKLLKEILVEKVTQKLLLEEAAKRKIVLDEKTLLAKEEAFKNKYREMSFQKTLEAQGLDGETWKKQKAERLTLQKLIEEEIKEQAPEEAKLKTIYEARQQDFMRPARLRLRQIVVADEKLAKSLAERLRRGENFAQLASLYSIAPEAKREGDLGLKVLTSLPEPLQGAWNLKIGEVSKPIESPYGFHLLKVLEKKEASLLSFEEAKEHLAVEWWQEKREEAFKNLSQKVLEDRQVQFNWPLLKEVGS